MVPAESSYDTASRDLASAVRHERPHVGMRECSLEYPRISS